ncbi:MAG: site-specific integrase [Nitrososphaerota archaeon]
MESSFPVNDMYVVEYIDAQGPSFKARRRHYPLYKALGIFLDLYQAGSVGEALERARNGNDLHRVLQSFIGRLESEGLKPKTIHHYLNILNSFLRFYDVPYQNALKKVRKPKKAPVRVDRLPSIADLQKMILASKSPRLSMLIQLLSQTGLRLNEALNLKMEYIDFENNVINIPGAITKNGRPRQVPLISELKTALQNYLKKMEIEHGYIFPSEENRGRPWLVERVYDRYYALLKRLNLDQKDSIGYQTHLHTLRKWFKTQLEMANVNRLVIMSWMGHDAGVQAIYFMPSPNDLKKEIEKAEKALRIFGAISQALSSEKLEALEEAVKFYEALMDHIAKNNPRLLKILGFE